MNDNMIGSYIIEYYDDLVTLADIKDTISDPDLKSEAIDSFNSNEKIVFAVAQGIDENGYRIQTDIISILFFPGISRAGLCANGDTSWTDCDSIEDALERFLGINDKEMQP